MIINIFNLINLYFKIFVTYFGNNWNVLELPFQYIEPPFLNKYNNYNIVNNHIQILNYNDYLQNINTKYCIDFSNNLIIKIYNIFKYNIDQWLISNNIDKVYKLINKFLDNNSNDKEYFYISVYMVL